MYRGLPLRPPIFEIGLKGYMYGEEALRLAREADLASAETGVTILFDPQYVDIPAIARETSHILVFAQHMDPVAVGRGNGYVLPEALKAAGAHGTMLNHTERPMTLADIARAIQRADEVGLLTVVSSDSPEQAAAVAQLRPNIVLAEPPELIGGDVSVAAQMREFVERTAELVGRVDPEILVMCAAGIKSARDVTAIVELGVGATGTTSGITRAADPIAAMWEMVSAMGNAWEKRGAPA